MLRTSKKYKKSILAQHGGKNEQMSEWISGGHWGTKMMYNVLYYSMVLKDLSLVTFSFHKSNISRFWCYFWMGYREAMHQTILSQVKWIMQKEQSWELSVTNKAPSLSAPGTNLWRACVDTVCWACWWQGCWSWDTGPGIYQQVESWTLISWDFLWGAFGIPKHTYIAKIKSVRMILKPFHKWICLWVITGIMVFQNLTISFSD